MEYWNCVDTLFGFDMSAAYLISVDSFGTDIVPQIGMFYIVTLRWEHLYYVLVLIFVESKKKLTIKLLLRNMFQV